MSENCKVLLKIRSSFFNLLILLEKVHIQNILLTWYKTFGARSINIKKLQKANLLREFVL